MKLSRTVTGLLAVALLAFMVSDALGQGRRGQGGPGGGPGGGGRGPGGFGQRGGPGGGFGQRGGGDAVFGLLRDEAIKAEIELMPDQEEAIEKLAERSREESRGRGFDFETIRQMDEDERREFFAKLQKEREERGKKMREQLEEVLLPQQMERLDQISLQLRGVQALNDPTVAAKLKITDAQKKELQETQDKMRQEMRAKMQELFQQGDREAMREAFVKIREEIESGILEVLTSDQRKQFEEMKGEKFEMPPNGLFGGRGGFGGGRGRGGDGGRGRGGDGGGRRSRPEAEE
ncbi:MAG: hypothetical protein MI861_02115 [Pirellulales bacterium]|nr:hypothetical protein [Pirellulales bacterium]